MTPSQAVALQKRLRTRVEARDRVGPVRWIAGIDVCVEEDRARGAVVVLDARTLDVVEARTAQAPVRFPYIPGLLAFRELPVLRRALAGLARRPDLAIVDGHGLAHPRRFGIACHLGVALDLPSIGCGKTLLVGEQEEPGAERGSWTPLVHRGETIGAAVRTREGVRPVYVSVGHRISLPTAIRWILRLSPRYRLPEPIRAADARAGVP